MYWEVHDFDREQPPVVDPGPPPDSPQLLPEDATIQDLEAWEHPDTSAAQWLVEDGYV
jgi:hypothetical protein